MSDGHGGGDYPSMLSGEGLPGRVERLPGDTPPILRWGLLGSCWQTGPECIKLR